MASEAGPETSLDDLPLAQTRSQRVEDDNSSLDQSPGSQSENSSISEILLAHGAQQARSAIADERWEQLREDYRDDYVELLKETFEQDRQDDGVPDLNLGFTQLGAVMWDPSEKLKLYTGIARIGRHDIPKLAKAVGSKSQLEIQDYLTFLDKQACDAHLFARHIKAISHADILAAVEISEECESALEAAADALAAYQNRYDNVAIMVDGDPRWIIDRDVAKAFDAKADNEEEISSAEDKTFSESAQLFRLSSFVDLSERIFMNSGGANIHSNWRRLTREGETPALVYGAVTDLNELVVSLTRRLMQTAMFLAQSRMRCTKVQGYTPQSVVKLQDVKAALEVLNMKSDLWSYWVTVARRNQLNVLADPNKRGANKIGPMSYESVESTLTVRTARGYRRSRSMSIGGSETGREVDFSSTDDERMRSESESIGSSPASLRPDEEVLDSESVASSTDDGDNASDVDEAGGFAFHASTSKQKRRQILLDLEQDRYLEALDKEETQREEARLSHILGQEIDIPLKEEPKNEKHEHRPKVLRKAKDDLRDWVGMYAAEWEQFGAPVPAASFVETEQRRKRQRLDSNNESED